MNNRSILDADPDILPPSIDPTTRKIGVRRVRGRNEGGTRTEIRIRDFPLFATDEPDSLGGTNTAPSPLEATVAALVGCDGVIINGCARAMDFNYSAVDFEAEARIDVRGPKGVPGIRPYFEAIDLTITVYTRESDVRFEQLKKNVEYRCPVMNLMRAADVDLNVNWIKAAA